MIEPLQDTVIVKPIKETPEGVLLPERAQDTLDFGIVWLIGPDVLRLTIGDVVVLPTWYDDKLEVDGVKYNVLAEKNISVRISE
jgi:co-chaperonin GroES (HSP10)